MADKVWAPTRGYFVIGEASGGDDAAAPAAADAAQSAPSDDASPAAAAEAPAPAPTGGGGGGTQCWAPTRGYFTVGSGGGGGSPAGAPAGGAPAAGAQPAAAAPEKKAPAAPAKKAAAKPAAKKAAKKPAAAAKEAKPAAPLGDPEFESVTRVPTLTETAWGKAVGQHVYSEPDSETTLYKVSALNVAFTICSAILLLYTILVLWQDYWRPWKQIQADWNDHLVEELQVSLVDAKAELEQKCTTLEPELIEILKLLVGSVEFTEYESKAAQLDSVYERCEYYAASARELLDSDEEYSALREEWISADTQLGFAETRLKTVRSDMQAEKYLSEEEKVHELGISGTTPTAEGKIDKLSSEFKHEFEVRLEKAGAEVEEWEAKAEERKALLDQYVASRFKASRGEEGSDLVSIEGALQDYRRATKELQKRIFELDSNWRNTVRNAPILDALAPTYQVKKRVADGLHEDLNFITVPRIDRCQTCHINIDDTDPSLAGFESETWGSVYASHPRLDLFVSSTSPHPYDTFGCTVCHMGDGHSTDFNYAAHTPQDEKQKKEWEEKYHWHKLKYQDYPMLQNRFVTSSCRKCHTEEEYLEGGGNYNRGYRIVKNYGCFGCHKIEQFADEPKVGPSLEHIADKVDVDFLYKWIRDPQNFRHSARMPRFFDLTNSKGTMEMLNQNGEPVEVDFDTRNGLEVLAISTYLMETSKKRSDMYQLKAEGDVARGRALIKEIGCLGCHSIKRESLREGGPQDLAALQQQSTAALDALAALAAQRYDEVGGEPRQQWLQVSQALPEVRGKVATIVKWFEELPVGVNVEQVYSSTIASIEKFQKIVEPVAAGEEALAAAKGVADEVFGRWVYQTRAPDLGGTGSKVKDPNWLADWILDPRRHDPRTIMPIFRLHQDKDGDQRVADMVAYLMSLRDEDFEKEPVFELNTTEKSTLLSDMVFDYKRRDMPRGQARAEVAASSTTEQLKFLGQRLVRRYGCFGCHVGIQDIYSEREGATFDEAQAIGAELEGWGVKEVKRLDFGLWGHQHNDDYAIPKERHSWAEAKLTDTRRFDVLPIKITDEQGEEEYIATGRLVQKTHEELLKMPRFAFADDPEQVEAVTTFLLSLDKDPVQPEMKRKLTGDDVTLEKGRRLIEQLNCQGCHRVGAENKYVHVDELPLFSYVAETTPDQARREILERETWLARPVRLQYSDNVSDDVKEPGIELPHGALISQQVWDPTSMDPDNDEPLSLVELAHRYFDLNKVPQSQRLLPLAGYQEGLIRAYMGPTDQERFRAPPPLVRQGERVRSEWFLRFLMDVTTIRPMLKVRMPSFHLNQEDAHAIVAWFKARAGLPMSEVPEADWYDPELATLGHQIFGFPKPGETGRLQCNACHPSGDVLPTEPVFEPADRFDWKELPFAVPDDSAFVVWKDAQGAFQLRGGFSSSTEAKAWAADALENLDWVSGDKWDKSSWGPDLGLSAERLRPEWIKDWLKNPPDFMPGTKMTNFFGDRSDPIEGHPLEAANPTPQQLDSLRRIDALIQYLVHMQTVNNAVAKGNGSGSGDAGGD